MWIGFLVSFSQQMPVGEDQWSSIDSFLLNVRVPTVATFLEMFVRLKCFVPLYGSSFPRDGCGAHVNPNRTIDELFS